MIKVMDPPPCPSQGRGVVTTALCPHQQDIILPPLVGGFGEGSVGVFGVCCSLHATRCTEGGRNCREDGDYYVEDLTPESVVVESSHFV